MPVDKRITRALIAIEDVYGMDEFDPDLADGALLLSRNLLRDYVYEITKQDWATIDKLLNKEAT